jgi:hypothetical protein
MELYQTALEMLVQRRDAERAIPSAREVRLSLTDKLCVLRDLAWRLSDNNRHELSEDKAVEYVQAKVTAMRHVDVAGRQVFDHLLERSGVLRAPEERRVDFVHRTFPALPPLKCLWLIRGIGGNDLAALRHRPELISLVLFGGTVLDDVSPIAGLSQLTNLQIEFWESIPRIDNIPILPKLTNLGLGQLPANTDLTPLQAHAQLKSITLGSAGRPRGLAVLSSFTELTRV